MPLCFQFCLPVYKLPWIKASLKPVATVKRDGKWTNIDAALVVPGDLVLLAAGSAIPADCLVNDGTIDVDQAALTGESLPVTMYKGSSCKMGSNVVRGEVEGTVEFTGANTFFAQVIFQKNQKNAHFMGGKLVKTKEIFLNGQIRAGRTSKVKKKLILGLRKILIKNTKLQSDFVWVYLEDLLPDQMIEYGEVLPKSGQEKKWFNSLTQSLKKRLRKMEKRK